MSHRNVSDEESTGLYATPPWTVEALLQDACELHADCRLVLPGGRWLGYCAGEGGICYAVNRLRKDVKWTAVERDQGLYDSFLAPACSRGELAEIHRSDFFDIASTLGHFDVAMDNPAFPTAAKFVKTARLMSTFTLALERLDFLSGGEKTGRSEFYKAVGPPDVWTLADRPKFRGRGQDSGDYAWFVWGPGVTGKIHRLPPRPAARRREHRLQLRLGE